MPKRSTATYTSEDAPQSDEAALYVYYCKYSGEHCLITDAALGALPRRRTDGAYVLDTQKAVVRVQAALQPVKYIKRCVAVPVAARGGGGVACGGGLRTTLVCWRCGTAHLAGAPRARRCVARRSHNAALAPASHARRSPLSARARPTLN
jgi:hypothetical protein